MFVADSLYGGSDLPPWLDALVLTPEVQRLRGIRLINSSSPSLAALSDARRYTHTLGVLRLVWHWLDTRSEGPDDARVLSAAALCHDIGTPPFGHIFEYLLSAMLGWSHEHAVQSILEGTYRPEGVHHQIFAGRAPNFGRVLEAQGIDPTEVAALARGEGRLGPLLAGSLDLDNLDNVFRMAHLLGLPSGNGLGLAAGLTVIDGRLAVQREATGMLAEWAETRRRVYSVLAFDETNLQGQAMLTDCLSTAMAEGEIGRDHWFWTDEWLLYRLETFRATKPVVQRFLLGDLYSTVYLGWYDLPRGPVDWRHPARRAELKAALEAELGFPCSPYVFYDQGTFSKVLDLAVVDGGTLLSLPTTPTSVSSIVGVFTARRRHPARAHRTAAAVLETFGFAASALVHPPTKTAIYGLPGQESLSL